jgi:hypothetical protein
MSSAVPVSRVKPRLPTVVEVKNASRAASP